MDYAATMKPHVARTTSSRTPAEQTTQLTLCESWCDPISCGCPAALDIS
ncbi:hypothetical protein I553_8989 [Mycobacterium xenopi 4042]|uniref:Uncharacterized protein n=1 Tax=Mycobacterium xenopi 4042 TaxID=1299334 RepID=X8AQ28_MYCXE|nr:hypothetical protein I553_8989 [Mycobacterium xenopi 4042]